MAAPRKSRWALITAAIHLVFVSIRRRFTPMQLQSLVLWRRPTGSRLCGGPAITTTQPVNGGVDFHGMAGMGGAPDITATEGDNDEGSSVLFESVTGGCLYWV
jgi:hypothetical protein